MPKSRRPKISLPGCSVPVEYVFADAALFTQKWWSNVVKLDAFWTDLGKHLSQSIIRKRIMIDIKTETEGQSHSQQKRGQMTSSHRDQSASVTASSPEVGGNRAEYKLDVQEELAREVEELWEMAAEAGDTLTGEGKRSRKSTANRWVEKVECVRCGQSFPWSELDFDASSNPICTKCIDAVQAETNVTAKVPKARGESQKATRNSQSARPATNVIRVADDVEPVEIQARGMNTIPRPSHKRNREDSGQVVTIQGREFLVYVDQDGKAQLVKLEEQSSKRVKALGER
ncbi:hypothetical protein CLAIMM_10399 [Cladophialophora immunda]|nr:hypothetical protein CLAIMM_10399 [Cladophialophora immunda]